MAGGQEGVEREKDATKETEDWNYTTSYMLEHKIMIGGRVARYGLSSCAQFLYGPCYDTL